MAKRCAIIGAGASGLPSARWALAYGIEPVVFESQDHIGGLWKYKSTETEAASVMKSTIINTAKEMTAYSDFPPQTQFANFMHNRQMLKYLEQYAQFHGLYPYIRFQHTVLGVYRSDDYDVTRKWRVEYKNENGIHEETFDCVLLCQGHHVKPNLAGTNWPDRDLFKGRVIHSHSYKDTKDFEDSVSVVVGVGNSGVDIAVELSRVCKKVYLSTRRGSWIQCRVGSYGQPLDMERLTRFKQCYLPRLMPNALAEWLLIRRLQERFDHAKFGLMPKHSPFSQHGTINDELPNRIISGTVSVKPNIKRFTSTGVIWEDGSESFVDNVILATGYHFDFSLVEHGQFIPVHENRCHLYKHIWPVAQSNHNSLGVVGLIQGNILPVAEMQARAFFAVFTENSRLPSKEEIMKEIENGQENMLKRFVKSSRHTIQIDHISFMDSLASIIDCMPRPFSYVLSDPKLAHNLIFVANCSYAYRLRGPHAWPGARDALLTAQYRTDACLSDRDPGVFWKDGFQILAANFWFVVCGLIIVCIIMC